MSVISIEKTASRSCNAVKTIKKGDDFNSFREQGVGGTIWERSLPSDFQNWIDTLPSEKLQAVDQYLVAGNAGEEITNVCDQAGISQSPQRLWLEQDIEFLVSKFSQLMEVRSCRIRIDIIADDACPKFHVDNVFARLICTYRGPGTQYGVSLNENAPENVLSVPNGAPIILRGKNAK